MSSDFVRQFCQKCIKNPAIPCGCKRKKFLPICERGKCASRGNLDSRRRASYVCMRIRLGAGVRAYAYVRARVHACAGSRAGTCAHVRVCGCAWPCGSVWAYVGMCGRTWARVCAHVCRRMWARRGTSGCARVQVCVWACRGTWAYVGVHGSALVWERSRARIVHRCVPSIPCGATPQRFGATCARVYAGAVRVTHSTLNLLRRNASRPMVRQPAELVCYAPVPARVYVRHGAIPWGAMASACFKIF